MKISSRREKPLAYRLLAVSFGMALCCGDAKPTSNNSGTITTMARQLESPAFIRQATFGIVDSGASDNCKPQCIALDRIVLRNRSDAPITNYRLGLVIVFADPKTPAEIHTGNSFVLTKTIGPKQEKEFKDNLVPLVDAAPTIRMICYFVAEAQQANGRIFAQDRDRILKCD